LGRRARRAEFRAAVALHFRFLNDLGYTSPRFTTGSHVILGEEFQATFGSPMRTVVIHVANPRDGHPLMLVHVYREPRTSVDDDFELTLFLRKHQPDVAQEIDRIERSSGGFQQFIQAIIPAYANALATHAQSIVKGQDWVSGFYADWTV